MKPVGDIDVIKAILLKAHEKLKTAQIDFIIETQREIDIFRTIFHTLYNTLLCSKEVENIGQLRLFKDSEGDCF